MDEPSELRKKLVDNPVITKRMMIRFKGILAGMEIDYRKSKSIPIKAIDRRMHRIGYNDAQIAACLEMLKNDDYLQN